MNSKKIVSLDNGILAFDDGTQADLVVILEAARRYATECRTETIAYVQLSHVDEIEEAIHAADPRPSHTPGPWTARPFYTPFSVVGGKGKPSLGIYLVEPAHEDLMGAYSRVGDTAGSLREEAVLRRANDINDANARLIEAAPTLLEAAQALVEEVQVQTSVHRLEDKGLPALAAMKGVLGAIGHLPKSVEETQPAPADGEPRYYWAVEGRIACDYDGSIYTNDAVPMTRQEVEHAFRHWIVEKALDLHSKADICGQLGISVPFGERYQAICQSVIIDRVFRSETPICPERVVG